MSFRARDYRAGDHGHVLARARLLNEHAQAGALNPHVQRTMTSLVRGCKDVVGELGAKAARYVRRRYAYTADPHGVELFKGPEQLRYTNGGDCDCLTSEWVSIMRAAGCPAYAALYTTAEDLADGGPLAVSHAVGYDRGTRQHYELSDGRAYFGGDKPPVVFSPEVGGATLYWSGEPWHTGYFMSVNEGQTYQSLDSAPCAGCVGLRLVPGRGVVSAMRSRATGCASCPGAPTREPNPRYTVSDYAIGALGLGAAVMIGGVVVYTKTRKGRR